MAQVLEDSQAELISNGSKESRDELAILLQAALKIVTKRLVAILTLSEIFALFVWTMLAPDWMRLATAATFTLASIALLNLGLREI
jgi:hypothetical protein